MIDSCAILMVIGLLTLLVGMILFIAFVMRDLG